MAQTHPHAEAIYRVIPFNTGAFAVEVSIPESYPATVSAFATEADAKAWIAEHRHRIQSEDEPLAEDEPLVSQFRQKRSPPSRPSVTRGHRSGPHPFKPGLRVRYARGNGGSFAALQTFSNQFGRRSRALRRLG
jgi:hypothetical protein